MAWRGLVRGLEGLGRWSRACTGVKMGDMRSARPWRPTPFPVLPGDVAMPG